MDSSVAPVPPSVVVDSTSNELNLLTTEDAPVLRRQVSENDKKDVTDAKAERNSFMRPISDLFNRNSTQTDSIRLPVERNALEYKMSHEKRGLAYIFNHENFDDDPSLKPRIGTEADCQNLKQTLEHLSFEVVICKDLNYGEIIKEIEKVSKEIDHTDHDCLLISILSYGHFGHIYAKDKAYNLESIWEHFTANNCKTLGGKPKLFFIQACAREQLVNRNSRMLRGTTETDSSDSDATFKIPIHADFLIVYSSVPGFHSWKNTEKGCWFIQCLCHELRNGNNFEILDHLTFVNQRMANVQKQVSCIKTMLTRFLYFRKPQISNATSCSGASLKMKTQQTNNQN